MSLGVAIAGPEGVVIASDTRVTLTAQPDPNRSPISVNYDNSHKLLTFGEIHNHVAAAVQGQATINGRTIHGWMPEFLHELPAGPLPVGEYAVLLQNFFLNRAAGTPDANRVVEFIVGGVSPGDRYGEIHRSTNMAGSAYSAVRDFGMSWGGQTNIVSRLVNGYDPAMPNAIANEFPDLKLEEVMKTLGQFKSISFPWESLPLQDCVDLATFFIRTTMAAQRLSVGLRGVGGMVEIVVITPADGLQWLQRLELRGDNHAAF